MRKTLYDIQDTIDGAYALLDELSEQVNELITENESLKAKLTKERVSRKLDKISAEEQAYLDYFKEYYGKELI